MAGIKLKSGADFCNFQATRMCLHNDPADPTSDYGNGRIYFNTSTSVGSGKHVRIYDGSNFRSLAYFDEIDERLNLIEGSVDTSELINNLADVQAFLKDIKESDGDLMTMLNGKLDKKGGTIEDAVNTPLTINSTSTAGTVGLSFKKNGTEKGWIGYTDNQGMSICQGGKYLGIKEGLAHFDGNTLIHEGNIGSYKAGDSGKLEGKSLSWVQGHGLKFSRVKTASASDKADANADLAGGGMIYCYSGLGKDLIINAPSDMKYGQVWQIGSYNGDALDGQLAWDANHNSTKDVTNKLWWRARDSSNGWTYAKWHQIAFTDSNVASATKLEDDTAFTIWGNTFFQSGKPKNVSGSILLSNATYIRSYLADKESTASLLGVNASDDLLIGYGLKTLGDVGIYGKTIYFASNGEAIRVRISESGAVYINSAVASEDTEKLIVGGVMRTSAITRQMATQKRTVMSGSSDSLIIGDDKGLIYFRGSEIAFQTQTGQERNMTMIWTDEGPRVGIGTSTPTEKLHVVGNLYVTGNIVADGEVSAGGAGTESGTGGGGTSGGGDALIFSKEFTPSTQVVSIAHGLSATKGVIVQVWEQNADGQSWSVVLVDIEEVDSNNIKLNFGRTETTLHKVVVMG